MPNAVGRRGLFAALGAFVALLAASQSALALDAYQDRRGFFGGFGLGGGAAFEGSEAGGSAIADFQLGGGATRNLTLAIDVDLWFHVLDDNTKLLVDPGPEVTYFFGSTGIFVRAGIGAGLVSVWPDTGAFRFKAGFDASLGVGWEFFVSANVAIGLTVEGDYIVLSGDDLASVAALFTVKRY